MNPNRRRKFKLKITEYNMKREDREVIINKHKHIEDLQTQIKKVSSKTEKRLHEVLKIEIQNTRFELMDNYAHKFYNVTVMLGPHKEEKLLPYYPSTDDINMVKASLTARLSKDRAEKKRLNVFNKEFNGIQYKMVGANHAAKYAAPSFSREFSLDPQPQSRPVVKEVKPKIMAGLIGSGNVFAEPNTMLKYMDGPGYAARIRKAKVPYDKSNYVGVEIELICKVSREVLDGLFVAARLASHVHIKTDSSIRQEKDNEITHEITLIGKQQDINNIITRVCAVLNSKEVGAYVNDSCGLHVHIDMRHRTYPVCFRNFVHALPVLAAMVPAGRTQSQYCKLNKYSEYDSPECGDRRHAINPVSFRDHKTLEIRLHSGSTNAVKLNNWVNILTAIADKVESHTTRIELPDDMRNVFGVDSKLVEYMKTRIDKFKNNKAINTKDDHFDQSA